MGIGQHIECEYLLLLSRLQFYIVCSDRAILLATSILLTGFLFVQVLLQRTWVRESLFAQGRYLGGGSWQKIESLVVQKNNVNFEDSQAVGAYCSIFKFNFFTSGLFATDKAELTICSYNIIV
jgi:hypothetical protein